MIDWLSPLAPTPIQTQGHTFPTLEHALLATGRPDLAPLISNLSASDLTTLLSQAGSEIQPLTASERSALIQAKFQHPAAAAALIHSGFTDLSAYGDIHQVRLMERLRQHLQFHLAQQEPGNCVHCLFARHSSKAGQVACLRPQGPLRPTLGQGTAFPRQWPEQETTSLAPAQLRRRENTPLVPAWATCPAHAPRVRTIN